MWAPVLAACRSMLLPFLIDNMIPIVNFVGLILVLVGLQKIRLDLAGRIKRFERIERELDIIQQQTKDLDGQP
jgi:hypothetical protein